MCVRLLYTRQVSGLRQGNQLVACLSTTISVIEAQMMQCTHYILCLLLYLSISLIMGNQSVHVAPHR